VSGGFGMSEKKYSENIWPQTGWRQIICGVDGERLFSCWI